MDFNQIYFITSNQAKIIQLSQIPGVGNFSFVPVNLDIDEIQSMDNKKVVQDKILKAHQYISNQLKNPNCWVMCEDTGYSFENMGNFPGALIRFYHDSIGNAGICKFHAGSRATNTSYVAITNGIHFMVFSNNVGGIVPNQPRRVSNGSQWIELDTVFIPDCPEDCVQFQGLAYSELPIGIKTKCSARGKSFTQLINWLESVIKTN